MIQVGTMVKIKPEVFKVAPELAPTEPREVLEVLTIEQARAQGFLIASGYKDDAGDYHGWPATSPVYVLRVRGYRTCWRAEEVEAA